MPNNNYYLALDPGHTTGWATFDEDGNSSAVGQVKGLEGLHTFLSNITPHPEIIIFENFKLFGWKAAQQSGSQLETVQAIGVIKAACFGWGRIPFDQNPNIKPIAERYSGVKANKNHAESHKDDAYNHGIYYLVTNKLINPTDLL